MMKNCPVCSRMAAVGETITAFLGGACKEGGAAAAAAYAAVVAWIGGLVISEALLLKTFFVSVGILIGAAFSDFFKKHRWLVVFVLIGSVALFLYKAIADMEEDDAF
ncbi:MAG: hypothetical protein ACI4PM_02695 [Butyricicoccus sp.]